MPEFDLDQVVLVDPPPRFRLSYFDTDWEEHECLTCDSLTTMEVMSFITAWVRSQTFDPSCLTRGERILSHVAALTMEVDRG